MIRHEILKASGNEKYKESRKNSPDVSVGSGGFCVKRVTMEQVDKVGQTPGSVASPEARVTCPGDQSSEDVLITEATPE